MKAFLQIIFGVFAVLSALYGVVVCMANSGTLFFAVWFAIAAFFLLCALSARFHWLSALPLQIKTALLILLAACVLVFVVCEGLILSHFNDKGEDDLDAIVVLGAQVRQNGPSVVLRYRLDAAYDYLTANPRTRCIVTGGQGANEPVPEAEAMRDYLVERGISADRILVENQSKNTIGNIRNALPMIDAATERVGIVTNNFHVFRGVSIAKKQGIQNITGVSAPSNPLYLPNNMLREFVGVVKDKLMGNL